MKYLQYLKIWLFGLFSGKPHFVIGNPGDPYLLRWYLIPRNPFFNIYLHKFLRSDDDRAPHDHPWWFVSLMIAGGYIEHFTRNGVTKTIYRGAPSIAFRRTTDLHIVELYEDFDDGTPFPCWTIVITGTRAGYIQVRFDGMKNPRSCHPTWRFEYEVDGQFIGFGMGE